jgi:hypothetical protein
MAQAFIYFGLLKEILGEEFHLEDFLTQRDTEGGQIVTLKTLAQKLSNLRGQQNEYSIALAEMGNGVSVEKFGYLKKVNEDIRGKLRRGIGWAVWLLQDIDAAEEASVLCLSLEILAWSLSKCLPLTVDLAVAFRWLEYDGKLIFENRLLLRRFKEAGWCPHLSRRYTRANSAALLYYASALRQSRHEDCTESKCIAYDVDENQSYKMEHAKKGCQCGLRGPDMNRVKAIIASGGIPLIKLTRKETVFSRLFGIDSFNNECTECLDVDVEEYKPGMEYIAISHVWVDGLGNPNDNSIHECQLEYLYRVLRGCDPLDYSPTRLRYSHYDHKFAWEEHNVPVMGRGTGNTQRKYHGLEPWRRPWNKPSVWMWIDTLCVPCGKDRLRRLALNTMAMTYALADQVAVIDRTMSNVSFASSSDLEVALRLLSSPWMARCWTYQEACLARKYSFVLKDGMLSPSWWSRVNESNFVDRCGTQMEQRLKYECLEWFDEIPSIMAIASSGELDDFLETLMELLYPPIWRYLKESFLRSEDAGGSDAEALKAFDEETKRQSAAAHAQRRRFFDLHKRSHSITSNQLTNIWNQVSSRGTTKREDLHGILAALLGLSVSEVLDIAVNERLRAVLKTLDRLPLEMMYCWYSPADRAIPGCNWIPTYPTGRLIWEDPITKLGRCETGQYMKWNSEWNLEVSCMPPVMRSAGQFIVSSSQNLYHEFLLGHVEDLAPDGVQKYFVNDVCSRSIKVVILGTDPVISRSSHGLLISLAWNNEKAGTGAIFRPRSPWQRAEADKPPTVEFIAAVQFYQLDCAGLNGSDEESQRLPMIKIDGEMQYDASFIIEMGKFECRLLSHELR